MKELFKNINTIFFAIGSLGIIAFIFLFNSFVQNQNLLAQQQMRIQKETYIKSLFAEYKNNVDSCRKEAQDQKKDDKFIKENCIDVINSSLLGQALTNWGREDLLITK